MIIAKRVLQYQRTKAFSWHVPELWFITILYSKPIVYFHTNWYYKRRGTNTAINANNYFSFVGNNFTCACHWHVFTTSDKIMNSCRELNTRFSTCMAVNVIILRLNFVKFWTMLRLKYFAFKLFMTAILIVRG